MKQIIKKEIFSYERWSEIKWKDIKHIQFEDEDIIEFDVCEQYPGEYGFTVNIVRLVEETDEELIIRLQQESDAELKAKEKRYETYLKYKDEFEN